MTATFLDAPKQAAADAERTEADFRRDFAARVIVDVEPEGCDPLLFFKPGNAPCDALPVA